jgi:hypothetical protein
MTAPAPDNLATPRRRRRRWWLRVPLIALGLVVMVIVLTQIFLWTDYPRQIAEAQVERILRVRASIKSVSIGWLGNTRIEGVTLTLPMESEPFLQIDRIDASHASLPLIAFSEDLRSVEVRGVEMIARQDASGRWNLQQLLTPSTSSGATTQATARRPRNPLAEVPTLRIDDVKTTLVRHDGKRLAFPIAHVALVKHDDTLTADVMADMGAIGKVEGLVGQSTTLPQTLKVAFDGLPPEVAAFFGVKQPSPFAAKLAWSGHLTADGIAGTLNVLDARVDELRIAGRIDIDTGERIAARPTDLSVTIADGAKLDLRTTAGTLTYDGTVVADGLAGTLNGGRYAVDGTFDPRTLAADIAAKWAQVTRNALATSGSAHLKTTRLFDGKIKVEAEAKGGVRVPAGEAIGAATINGEADSLDAFTADLQLDPFTWTPKDGSPPIVTPRLRGDLKSAGTSLRLEAFGGEHEGVGSLAAYAGVDRAARLWWANLDASQVILPALEARGIQGPVDVSLAADGTLSLIHVERAYAQLDKATAYATGDYDFSLPRPVTAMAWAWYDKPVTEDQAAQLSSLHAEAKIEGTVAPRDLQAVVDLRGSELVFAGRKIGDVSLNVDAAWSEQHATIHSKEVDALGGRWTIDGRWSEKERRAPIITAKFRDVPAKNIGKMFDRDDLGGMIDSGVATLYVRSSRLDQLEMTATARGSKLFVGPFKAEKLDLVATARRGRFEVTPTLHQQGGTIEAKLAGDVLLTTPVRADVMLDEWPAPYVASNSAGAERFRPRVSGRAAAGFSVRTGEVVGEVALHGKVERDDTQLATFAVEGTLNQKQVEVTKLTLDTLDGTFDATASFNLADWNASRIDARFDELTPARLSWSNPIAAEVLGRVSGTFAVRPSTMKRALGPLEISLKVQPDGMSFRKVSIGDLEVLAYADAKSADEFRVVTDHASLHVAGGTVEPFARLSSEPQRGLAQLVTARFTNLDLGQIAKAVDDDGKDLVGKVGGRVQLYGQTTRLATLAGDATIEITESDLVNFGPIAALYNVLSVGTAGSKPIGAGTISLRFGEDVLTIEDATYFNRGVYANGFGPIRHISKGVDAEVDHVMVVGSVQPLRAVKLPFFGDINDTLAALQSSLTAIEVTGTAKEPKMQQVSIGAIGDTFQKILLGKARGDK